MRVIILNQFFYPDHSATSQLMTDLAQDLVQREISVTALAARGRYNGGQKLSARDEHKGIAIARAWATGFGKGRFIGRLVDYLTFYIGASWTLLRLPRHDVVMALTTPPLIGLVALLIGRLRKMRVVMLVQDLYPEIAVALGALTRRSVLTRSLDWLSRFVLRNSDRIIVLSDCMRRRVIEKLGDEAAGRIDIIHNWADGLEIQPSDGDPNPFAQEQGLEESFVVLFSGNWGQVNEFETVLQAARILRERADIVFLFIGDGAKASEIRAYCAAHNLTNVRLLPYQPRHALRHSLAAADASLVTLADGLAGLSVPSKSYGIMAAGRPILFVGDLASEIAGIVRRSGCGAAVASGQSEQLAAIVKEWASNAAIPRRMGENARDVFEREFDRPRAVDAYVRSLTSVMPPIENPTEEVGVVRS